MIELIERTLVQAPIERCFDLARSVEAHLAGNVHWGEEAIALAGKTSGLLEESNRVTWRARHFGVRFKLTSEITAMRRPDFFQDTMVRGPFRSMQHDHFFRRVPGGATEMRDVFRFSTPVLILGWVAEVLVLRRYMGMLLRERNRAIREIAETPEWRRYLPV